MLHSPKIFLAAFTFLLVACAGTNFSWDQARQLKVGMSEEEVSAIMGRPYMVTAKEGQTIWVWSYAEGFGGAKTLSVIFSKGKVVSTPDIPASF